MYVLIECCWSTVWWLRRRCRGRSSAAHSSFVDVLYHYNVMRKEKWRALESFAHFMHKRPIPFCMREIKNAVAGVLCVGGAAAAASPTRHDVQTQKFYGRYALDTYTHRHTHSHIISILCSRLSLSLACSLFLSSFPSVYSLSLSLSLCR